MVKELSDIMHDPLGARELLSKEIKPGGSKGILLWCTMENAQAHVNLAQDLSKNGNLPKAEHHLRIALMIYKRIETGTEYRGHLLHYMGVVVDRQKRRAEAERFYRMALAAYKNNRLADNVEKDKVTDEEIYVALSNFSLNMGKQRRESEAESFVEDYVQELGIKKEPSRSRSIWRKLRRKMHRQKHIFINYIWCQ